MNREAAFWFMWALVGEFVREGRVGVVPVIWNFRIAHEAGTSLWKMSRAHQPSTKLIDLESYAARGRQAVLGSQMKLLGTNPPHPLRIRIIFWCHFCKQHTPCTSHEATPSALDVALASVQRFNVKFRGDAGTSLDGPAVRQWRGRQRSWADADV